MAKKLNIVNEFLNKYAAKLKNSEESGISDRNLIEVLFDSFTEGKKYNHSDFNKILNSYKLCTDEFTVEKDLLTPEILGLLYENMHNQRKTKGVFYTPKQIAGFMCRESLNNYIKKNINVSEDILQYIENGDISADEALEIDNVLSNIKVCDPAVGCGAFAVGMLEEISMLRNKLTMYTKRNRTLYELKKHAVEKSIYGVDIDEGAVDIAKKRLWLSVFNENRNAENIDNINFNLRCGNALTGQVDFLTQDNYFDIVIANPPFLGEKGNKDIFQKVKEGPLGKYYKGKMDLLYFFFHLALDVSKTGGEIAFITTNYFSTAFGAKKLREDLKGRAAISKIINLNESKIFDTAIGQHNMITFLKKWIDVKLTVQVAVSKRKGLISENMLQHILDFRDKETRYYILEQKDLYYGKEFYLRIAAENLQDSILRNFDKIKKNGMLLGEICEISNGVQTQADFLSKKKFEKRNERHTQVGDGIYVLDENNPRDLNVIKEILKSPIERKFLKPFYKNSDIVKYSSNIKTSKWLIYINKNSIDINELPIISKHLNKFKTIIGESSYNAPYLHRPKNESIFIGPKIIAPQRCKTNILGFNETAWYASADVYFITSKNAEFDLKYILALLNSKVYYHWLYNMGKRKGEYLELYNKPLSEVPIIKASMDKQKSIVDLVDMIITQSDNIEENLSEINNLQNEIDDFVYKMLDA